MNTTTDEAEERVRALLDESDELVGLSPTGEGDAADYYLAVVVRDHPENDDLVILMERYAQLPAEWSDMTDTFLKNGVNRRVPRDALGDFARGLAQTYAGLAAQADGDTLGERETLTSDLTGDE